MHPTPMGERLMKVTERWYSERMGRDITVARWGTYGAPVLLFPTAGGDAEEAERMQLVASLDELLAAGRIKVYSCDSVAGMALTRYEGSTEYRMSLFNSFQEAVAREVVPAIHSDCGGPTPIVVAGASIGAFNSVAMLCRYPELFSAALGMSGTYDIAHLIGGHVTPDLYYATPKRFLPGLSGPTLDLLRQRWVVLASGTGAWEDIDGSWQMADVLGAAGVPNRVDDWGPGHSHDWPSWREMLPVYLDDLVP